MVQEVWVEGHDGPATAVNVAATKSYVVLFAALLVIALFGYLSLSQLSPPPAAPADAPASQFASGRAMQHVRAIAQLPHPVGAAEHAKVRDYIVTTLASFGLSPEVRAVQATRQRQANSYSAAALENIVARVKGTGGGPPLMLVSHYDSVPTGPGAADDGMGVAVMIETARALSNGPALKNDVILLFTDGEEIGMMGAKAYLEQSPEAREVGLVMNFEARGNGGPAIMFETSANNEWLIRNFAQAATDPVTNSLSYEIYRLLPNDTDLSVFKKGGLAGLNFANIEGFPNYHSRLDSAENLDGRTLQQQGGYALSLARHFGDQPLGEAKLSRSNAVFFNTLGRHLVYYPGTLALPLAALTLLIFVGVATLGSRRGRLTGRGTLLGFGVFSLALILGPVAMIALWMLVTSLSRSFGLFRLSDFYHPTYYIVSFIAFTVAFTAAVVALFRKRVSLENLAFGGLCWWMLLTLVTSFVLPGASYIMTWPLLFSLLGVAYWLNARERRPLAPRHLAALAGTAIPGVVLVVPMLYLIFVAMRLDATIFISMMVILLLMLLFPLLAPAYGLRRWLTPLAAVAVGIAAIAAGSFASGFDGQHPRSSSVFYSLNGDTQQAVWASGDGGTDAWTRQFFPPRSPRGDLAEYVPSGLPRGFMNAPAPALPLGAPNLQVTGDTTSDGVRLLKVHLSSDRQAPNLFVTVEQGVNVVGAEVNGQPLENAGPTPRPGRPDGWRLTYFNAPAQGIDLLLKLKQAGPVKLRVMDQSYGLPQGPDVPSSPRPGDIMSAPYQPYSDTAFVGKSFSL